MYRDGEDLRELSLVQALGVLFRHLSPARRKSFFPLLSLMLLGALAEVITIGAIVPVLAFMATPWDQISYVQGLPLVENLIFGVGRQNIIYVTVGLFALAAVAAGALRLILLRYSNKFVYGMSYELGVRLYTDTLHQSYEYLTQHNSSEIVASINKVQMITMQVLVPVMQAAISVVIGTFIIIGLVIIDPTVALLAGMGFGGIYLVASILARKRLRLNSLVIAQTQSNRIKTMQEGVGGIRDILLDRSQSVFVEMYEQAEASFRDARIKNAVLGGAPRFIVEALGMVLMATIAVVVAQRPGGLAAALPVLGALALGAQRLLPLIQLVYAGWASAMGNKSVVADVISLLHRPVQFTPHAGMPLPFRETIKLDGLVYAYPGTRGVALKEVTLEIKKGSRVGIVGKTGSGKSTLMDIILGLLEPQSGTISIDGVQLTSINRADWQRNIAHVPQAIFLSDTTIAENIAFGVRPDEIDLEEVQRAARKAELEDVIAALPEGYHTRVGERGVQLSGGQRQRIGIARALYKNASVLVFDEATSALDTETERAVMAAINRLDRNLTILIIAHRLSTLEGCDMLVRLENGNATPARNYTAS